MEVSKINEFVMGDVHHPHGSACSTELQNNIFHISCINKQHIPSIVVSVQRKYICKFNVKPVGTRECMFQPHIYTFHYKILAALIQTDKRIKVFTSSRSFSTWSNICVHSFRRCFCGIICTCKSWKIKDYLTDRATWCQSFLVISC
jgi:hypothetical protein